jgi:hypothetical protein
MKKYLAFWVLFFIFFLLFVVPKTYYLLTSGIPEYLKRTTFISQFWFVTHIISGILVYTIAPFQFSTLLRKRYVAQHRTIGKLYILLSVYCILTLYISIIPNGLCKSCQISHYMVTTIWLVFVCSAYLSIIQKRILLHQRFMISAFICAAYFVIVRAIVNPSMSFFNYIARDEDEAYFISDIATWFVPLLIIWSYWIIKNPKIRLTTTS